MKRIYFINFEFICNDRTKQVYIEAKHPIEACQILKSKVEYWSKILQVIEVDRDTIPENELALYLLS